MKDSSVKSILNHLGDTAVYVIRQDTHHILYYNDRVKKVTPSIKLGDVCHERWDGTCDNCPLLSIGDRETFTSFNYDDPFGDAVDITATRMIWEEDIPAFLISVNKHTLTLSEQKLESERKHLVAAATQVYQMIISANILKNKYSMIAFKSFLDYDFQLSGSLKSLFEKVAATIHPDEKNKFYHLFSPNAILNAFSEGKTEIYMEHKQYDINGHIHWTNTHVLKMNTDDNNIEAIILTSIIDNRKQLEFEKIAFEAGVTKLFVECFVINVDMGTFTTPKLNPLISTLNLNCDFDTMNKEYCNKLIFEEDKAKFREIFCLDNIRKEINEEKSFISGEFRRLTSDGSYKWFEILGIKVSHSYDGDKQMVLTCRDINDLKTAQIAQKNSNIRFISAVNGLYNQIYEVDFITEEIYQLKVLNGVMSNFSEPYSMNEHFSNIINNYIPLEYRDYYDEIVNKEKIIVLFNSGAKELYKECPRKVDGGIYHWYSTQVQLIYRDEHHFKVMYYLKDLENAKKEEEMKRSALMDALSLAEQANNAKTDFLSRMSHDIRTPMNAIMGMATIAKANVGNDLKISECLDKIGVSADFLLSLINDILDMSKIESGKMKVNSEVFNIRDFINNITTVSQSQIYEKHHKLSVYIDNNLEKEYIGDSLRLNQIIINLLSNAVKYTNENGQIKLSVLRYKVNIDSAIIEFIIEDNGIGMSDDFLKHLYDPFEQENNKGSRVFEGSGLGLSITRNLVHIMGGSISVSSKLGVGTTFSVKIPLKTADSLEYVELNNTTDDGCYDLVNIKGKHILLVEDNEINMDIAKTLLEMNDLIIDTAENGQEAVDKFLSSNEYYYDVILMDIRMPVMDGLEATRKIRSLDRSDSESVPIIAMTANAFSDDITVTIEAGMDAHIAKPIDINIIISEIKKHILCMDK